MHTWSNCQTTPHSEWISNKLFTSTKEKFLGLLVTKFSHRKITFKLQRKKAYEAVISLKEIEVGILDNTND